MHKHVDMEINLSYFPVIYIRGLSKLALQIEFTLIFLTGNSIISEKTHSIRQKQKRNYAHIFF